MKAKKRSPAFVLVLAGVVLVMVDAFTSLMWAIVAALCAAALIAVLRLARRQTLRQAGAI